MADHHCHAVNCDRSVPPSMHMCRPHWRMVPRAKRRALLDTYVPGQEQRKDPTVAYLQAAAECVEAVALTEGQPPADIRHEMSLYETWANLIDDHVEHQFGTTLWTTSDA